MADNFLAMLRARIETIQTEIASFESAIEDLRSKIQDIRSVLENRESRIDSLRWVEEMFLSRETPPAPQLADATEPAPETAPASTRGRRNVRSEVLDKILACDGISPAAIAEALSVQRSQVDLAIAWYADLKHGSRIALQNGLWYETGKPLVVTTVEPVVEPATELEPDEPQSEPSRLFG